MTVYIIYVILLAVICSILYLRYIGNSRKHACVVVLGDIGRSPRMQYHSISLTQSGFSVDVVGYSGSVPHTSVVSNESIKLHHLRPVPAVISSLPRLLLYAVKVLWQVFSLLFVLLSIQKPSHLLLQNPPALPTLCVCWFVCRVRNIVFVVDWHNYGYTILALALADQHPLVRFSKWYEGVFGRLSDYNICVTRAMREDLHLNWNVRATTMYDRPPLMFKQSTVEERHQLFLKLSKDYSIFKTREVSDVSGTEQTVFTYRSSDGDVQFQPGRPALLLSATSWTEDEDFSILLNALDRYECSCEDEASPPDLVCVITGRGPLKQYYIGQIEERNWQHVQVCTPWLEADDYPVLLGSGDLGVCLHMSSSGLDLPMKVVDMFGCGLPVCAIHFKCLPELVIHEHNGLVFHTDEQLAYQLQDLLSAFPESGDKLCTFRKNLAAFQQIRWDETWRENVLPIFQS